MNDVKQEAAIPPHKFYFLRIYFIKLFLNLLNDFVVLRNL
jgi:hypothetical protein